MLSGIATVVFWVIAALLVASALAVVLRRNIVQSALFLVLVFGAASGVFILLNAEFIAIVQILIYAGAVTILILFAIMLTRNSMSRQSNPANKQLWPAAIVCALLGASILFALFAPESHLATGATQTAPGTGVNNVARIGQLLYSPSGYSYVLPFEIASLVLLVAIVGAIAIGRED
ncbi:MAG TPA: NADH-quinone oxidoreductase subunit J [Ktedonobacterales bacterium]|jgi:NADH-quinone oxidoreductase subunit J